MKLFIPAFGSMLIKAANALLGFLTAILLARTLGVSGYGEYSFVFALVILLIIPSHLGVPTFVLRSTAALKEQNQSDSLWSIWGWAFAVVSIASVAVATLVFIAFFIVGFGNVSATLLVWGLALLPLVALGMCRDEALKGVGHVLLGMFNQDVLRPLLFSLLLIFISVFAAAEIYPYQAMQLHVISAAMTFVIGSAFLYYFSRGLRKQPIEWKNSREWLSTSLVLGLGIGVMVLNNNIDVIIVGALRSHEEVGVYRVAVVAAGLTAFGLNSLNSVLMPRIVGLYSRDDMIGLQELVTSSSRLVLLVAIAAALILVFIGEWLIDLAFGSEFVASYIPLLILIFAKFGYVVFGPTMTILTMSGNEKVVVRTLLVATVLNVVVSLVLTHMYGAVGAAVATAFSLWAWNLILFVEIRRRTGINSSPFFIKK